MRFFELTPIFFRKISDFSKIMVLDASARSNPLYCLVTLGTGPSYSGPIWVQYWTSSPTGRFKKWSLSDFFRKTTISHVIDIFRIFNVNFRKLRIKIPYFTKFQRIWEKFIFSPKYCQKNDIFRPKKKFLSNSLKLGVVGYF